MAVWVSIPAPLSGAWGSAASKKRGKVYHTGMHTHKQPHLHARTRIRLVAAARTHALSAASRTKQETKQCTHTTHDT